MAEMEDRWLSVGDICTYLDEKWTPKIGQCYKVESGLIKGIPKHGQTT